MPVQPSLTKEMVLRMSPVPGQHSRLKRMSAYTHLYMRDFRILQAIRMAMQIPFVDVMHLAVMMLAGSVDDALKQNGYPGLDPALLDQPGDLLEGQRLQAVAGGLPNFKGRYGRGKKSRVEHPHGDGGAGHPGSGDKKARKVSDKKGTNEVAGPQESGKCSGSPQVSG